MGGVSISTEVDPLGARTALSPGHLTHGCSRGPDREVYGSSRLYWPCFSKEPNKDLNLVIYGGTIVTAAVRPWVQWVRI